MSYKDLSESLEERTKDLLSQLTVDEKIGLITGHQAAIDRLGIKERFVGTEFARGWSSHDETQFCTVLPQTIGMASTFDKELIHKAGQLLVNNCMFRKDSPNATLYKGDKKNVIWRDNMLTGGMEF